MDRDNETGNGQQTAPDTHTASDSNESTLDRRDYLRTVGAAGGLGAFGTLAGASAGTDVARAEVWTPRDGIERHRTGPLDVVVEDETGEPIEGADVDVEMQEHEFRFGAAVDARELVDASEGDPYREHVRDLFNTVALRNHHTWRYFEEQQETADAATEWALEQDMDVRGHACLWGDVDSRAIPPDVVEAMGAEWPEGGVDEPDYDPDHVRERSLDHVEEIIDHYGDDITEWEVVTEPVTERAMIGAVEAGPGADLTDFDLVDASILAEWYERAQEVADREDVGLAVNESNVFTETDETTRELYRILIQSLGIDLDGIGIQCHVDAADELEIGTIWGILDEFAYSDVGLRITEFDTFQERQGVEWEDDEEKARSLSHYLHAVYSHPAVDEFVLWGLWDGAHWGERFDDHDGDAPLFYEDWTPKPAYEVWTELVYDQWWTDESGTTDSDGVYETSAFHGDHAVTVSVDGASATETISVTEPEMITEITVTVGDDGEFEFDVSIVENDRTSPSSAISVGEYEVRDTTGDGLYNDFDGDDETTHDDVTAFFENLNADAIRDNPDAFDFADNGEVGFSDVIELLRQA